ncbi:MAG: hypothetical protein AB1861_04935 [Cyanobacteriota bacterium]
MKYIRTQQTEQPEPEIAFLLLFVPGFRLEWDAIASFSNIPE